MDRKAGGGGTKGNSSVNDENKQPSQNANGRKRQDKRSDVKKEDSSQPTQAKGAPQATKEQMRMAQLFQNSTVSDKALQEKAEKVQAVTNCSAEEAILALHDCGNDVQAAVDLFLEKGSTLTDQWEPVGKKKTKAADKNQPSTRGRANQRNTSSRGGKSTTAQSAPRSNYVQDEPLSGQSGQQGSQTRFQGRQTTDGDGRFGQTQADGPPRRENNETTTESSRWDDADDNWQETLARQSLKFERSSAPTASAPLNVPTAGQRGAPANQSGGQGSVNSTGPPSWSTMVQKPSTWSSAVAGSAPPPAQAGPQKAPVNEANGWKAPQQQQAEQQQQQQQKPSGPSQSASGMQKPPNVPQVGYEPVDQSNLHTMNQHSINVRPDRPVTPDATQQLGMKFSGLTFDNSSYQQADAQHSLNHLNSGVQSQVYAGQNARSPYTSESRDSLPGVSAVNASRTMGHSVATEPLSPSKSTGGQNRNTGSPSHMIGVPSQTMTFGSSEHDLPTNTYSAKNIQSSNSFVNSQQSQTFPGANRGQGMSGMGDARGASAQGQTMMNSAQSPINPYASSQDSRYSQQPAATALSKSPSGRNDAVAGFGPQQRNQNETATQYSNPPSHQSQQTSPGKSSISTLPENFSSYGSQDMSSRNAGFGSYQASAQSATTQTQPTGMAQKLPSGTSQMTSTVQAPRTSATTATGFSMPKSTVQPSASIGGLNKPYGASQPTVSQSFLSQQPYLAQSQPAQYGQSTLPAMFAQNSGMEAQYGSTGMDPRAILSMLPMGSLQDYQSYQNSLSGLRDTSANLGYSTPDQVRRGVEALQNVQGTAQVSQQQLAGQPYGMSYGLTGQNYVYSPPSMTPGYHPYSNNPQMYTTPAANISGGYSKGTNTGLSNSYSSSYGQDLAVGDKLQNSAAYVAGNVSAFSNDPYMRSQGMLAGGSDLQGGYAYGASKTNNKPYEKSSQSYGMQMGNQPTAASHQYSNQYFPMAQQQQLHQMTQGMPQNSAGQAANHKQGVVKGQNQYQQWNN
ncbi:hypothetical protein RvY_13575 [Ramazzottius varieornatus]|uniref:UBA domain-containing protein n=1 Tax=Ramazzottius varieornatus TaxID=947166 RepID=A0A1D1VND8_RAMVA|nr:hypothetical protein RvY_13575 [Ramazzottius varieornatus]